MTEPVKATESEPRFPLHGFGSCKLCGQEVGKDDDRLTLARENLRLAKIIAEHTAALDSARREIEKLRGALEFYANGFDKKLTNSMMGVNTPALADGGKIAREALATKETL